MELRGRTATPEHGGGARAPSQVDAAAAVGTGGPAVGRSHRGSPRGVTSEEWGFAAYLASRDGYEDSMLPNGSFTGTPEAALDCICGLYLGDVTAWTDAPTDG